MRPNPSAWTPVALPLKLKVGTTFFGKPENRLPKKFLLLSDVSHKKGVGLALEGHTRLIAITMLKGRIQKNAGLCGRGLKLIFGFPKGGVGGARSRAALRAMYEAFCFPTLRRPVPGRSPGRLGPTAGGSLAPALAWSLRESEEASGASAFGSDFMCKKSDNVYSKRRAGQVYPHEIDIQETHPKHRKLDS